MSLRIRIGRDLRTATVAVVAASVVAGPTAVAASYVANADKVDNKYAELSVNGSPDAHNASQAATSVWAVRQGADDGFYYETIPTTATFDVPEAGNYLLRGRRRQC